MTTMKAARVNKYHEPYSIESIPIPKPADDQLFVKTGAAGFCHTGLPTFQDSS
jgi:alcohol dehydrogenase, propanol-preferring